MHWHGHRVASGRRRRCSVCCTAPSTQSAWNGSIVHCSGAWRPEAPSFLVAAEQPLGCRNATRPQVPPAPWTTMAGTRPQHGWPWMGWMVMAEVARQQGTQMEAVRLRRHAGLSVTRPEPKRQPWVPLPLAATAVVAQVRQVPPSHEDGAQSRPHPTHRVTTITMSWHQRPRTCPTSKAPSMALASCYAGRRRQHGGAPAPLAPRWHALPLPQQQPRHKAPRSRPGATTRPGGGPAYAPPAPSRLGGRFQASRAPSTCSW